MTYLGSYILTIYLFLFQFKLRFYVVLNLLSLYILASWLWTVDQKITQYGETLTLLCHVPNCCPKHAGWDSIDADGIRKTLFIDLKSHKKTASAKYDGEVKTNGYTLIIRNLTKQDVNVSYKCVYDSTIGDPLMLLEKDVFKGTCSNYIQLSILYICLKYAFEWQIM